MLCDITDALSFSFPFPLSPSSIEQFHCYTHVLHLSLYMIVLGFVYMFIFGSTFHPLLSHCLPCFYFFVGWELSPTHKCTQKPAACLKLSDALIGGHWVQNQ
jgi:hypothetical protein